MLFNGPQICSYHESPPFLQGNRFIKNGYRVDFTKMQCVKSLCMLSNETVNIWSHLIGVIWFLWAILDANTTVLPSFKSTSTSDHFVITIFGTGMVSCCLFSTLYHVFCCHSKQFYEFWYKIDLLGITLVLFGSYITALYYAFYCFEKLKTFYIFMSTGMLFFNICNQVFGGKRTQSGVDLKSVFLFAGIMVFGVLPAGHWIYLSGGVQSEIVRSFAPRILIMYLLAGSAVVFYLTKFPECLYPGKFDYIGASHQIWHLLILFALIWWYYACLDLMSVRLSGVNQCSSS